jgi:hypothetical protein
MVVNGGVIAAFAAGTGRELMHTVASQLAELARRQQRRVTR